MFLQEAQANLWGESSAFPEWAGVEGYVFILNDARSPREVKISWPHGPCFHGGGTRKATVFYPFLNSRGSKKPFKTFSFPKEDFSLILKKTKSSCTPGIYH